MSIAYLMELVAALAVGLGFSVVNDGIRMERGLNENPARIRDFAFDLFLGVASAELIGLAVERSRGRGPAVWGFGRWVWALFGVAALLEFGKGLAYAALADAVDRRVMPRLSEVYHNAVMTPWWLVAGLAWIPVAFWVTARLARLPGDPNPDAREWAGRVFGVTLPAVKVILMVVTCVSNS
jgi:hypothetical protein